MFVSGVISASAPYKWKTGTLSNGNTALGTYGSVDIITTDQDLTNLGMVKTVDLSIKGNSVITGDLHTYNEAGEIITAQTQARAGGVFGGGDESSVSGNTTVTLEGKTDVLGNVFGGGNRGKVGGDSEVKILDSSTKTK